MKVIRFRDRVAIPRFFKIGVEADHASEKVKFELPQFDDSQVAVLYWENEDHSDAEALPGGVLTVLSAMTQYPGRAECYINISVGNEIMWHSELFNMDIKGLPDTEEEISQAYPSAIQAGAVRAETAAREAEAAQGAAEDAQNAAEAAQEAAETARDTAGTYATAAAGQATEAAASAGAAAASATAAAGSATAAAGSATAAAGSATAAAGSAEDAAESATDAADCVVAAAGKANDAAASATAAAATAAQIVTDEAARQSAETARANAEASRAAAEEDREDAESARETAETTRTNAESARMMAEAGRQSTEGTRSANEAARQTAEAARVAAETARETAETARESASAAAVEEAEDAADAASAAAEAVSGQIADIKNAIETIDDVTWYTFKQGVYYYISAAGTTTSLTPTELAGFAGVLIPCQKGDVFRINIHSNSGTHQRGFVVIDEGKNVLRTCYTNRDYDDYELDLSDEQYADAAYLIVNNDCTVRPTGYYVIKGERVGKRLDALEDDTAGLKADVTALEGDVVGLETSKQDALTFDATPTADSANPVTSGGVKTAMDLAGTKMAAYIENATGAKILSFQRGAIQLGKEGSTVTPTPDTSTDLLQNYGCVYAPILPGQTVRYYMHGSSSSYRGWAFLDADNVIIKKAGSNNTYGDNTLTAPRGSAYLVLNSNFATDNDIWAIITDALPWAGLYVSLLGDSISALQYYVPSGNQSYYGPDKNTEYQRSITQPEQMWWYQVITALGGTPLIIDAWSGSGVTQGGGDDGTIEMSATSRCQNLHAWVPTTSDDPDAVEVTAENIGSMRTSPFLTAYTPAVGDYAKRVNPDIILSTGGTNDWTYLKTAESIGTYDAHTSLPDPDGNAPAVTTFREAYATMLCRIQSAYPLALTICSTGFFHMRPYVSKYYGNYNADSHLTMQDFDKAIREIAAIRACPVVELWRSGFHKYNYYPTFAADTYKSTTHPNELGHRVIAESAIPAYRETCAGYVRWLRESKA